MRALAFAAVLLTALTFAAAPSSAQQAPRIRGEVTARTGNDITVKTVEGKTVTVALDPAFTVNHTVKAKLADIKPGDFVGTGAYPDGDAWKAAEVHIFPKGSRQGEGHRPWSSDPTGTMTNAEVTADAVAIAPPTPPAPTTRMRIVRLPELVGVGVRPGHGRPER